MNQDNTGNNQEIRDEKGRFLPGVSGNPAGKPVGARHMTTLLEEAIKRVADDEGDADDLVIVKKVIEKAKAGDMRAIDHIWSYLDGKPTQKTELTGKDGEALFPERRAEIEKAIDELI